MDSNGKLTSILASTDGQAGGPFSRKASEMLSAVHDGSTVLLTTSCTDALEMSAILANVGPGDTVIVPSFGFVTTALAFVRTGATVRYADIEEKTLGLDPDSVASVMDETVKAIVPIHYAGVSCDIEALGDIAADAGAVLVEDNAHGLFGLRSGRALGTFGALSTLSFHATKNISCGEGGALVINDESLIDRAHVVLEKGTDRRAFFQGAVDKYTWRDLGSSFGMSDYLAAILVDRLERAEVEQKRRRMVSEAYDAALRTVPGISVPRPVADDTHAYHLYPVVLEDRNQRDKILAELRSDGTAATFHFVPLHETPAGQRFGTAPASCEVSERVAASLIRLPIDASVSSEDATRTGAMLREILERHWS